MLMQAELAPNTIRAYTGEWSRYVRWCSAAGRDPLPSTPETVGLFVGWCIQTNRRLQTIRLRLAAITFEHKKHDLPNPVDASVKALLNAAARSLREKPNGKKPITIDQLREMSEDLLKLKTEVAVRNRALILLGFHLGWRRSELVALNVSDLEFTKEGLRVRMGASKTDQTGKGRVVGLPLAKYALTCAVRATRAWLKVRGDWEGPLFVDEDAYKLGVLTRDRMEGSNVHRLVKRLVARAGHDARDYGAHSLRAGLVTAAVENGASEISIMHRTGHRDINTLQRYARPGASMKLNPLAGAL